MSDGTRIGSALRGGLGNRANSARIPAIQVGQANAHIEQTYRRYVLKPVTSCRKSLLLSVCRRYDLRNVITVAVADFHEPVGILSDCWMLRQIRQHGRISALSEPNRVGTCVIVVLNFFEVFLIAHLKTYQ